MSADFERIIQHGYVVGDVEAAARAWGERLGVGPFYVIDQDFESYWFQGAPLATPLRLRIACSFWGDLHIELIQPLAGSDNLYSRAVREEGGRLNHCAVLVDDLDETIRTRGLEKDVLQSGSVTSGVKFVYLGRYMPGGEHLEVIQPSEQMRMGLSGLAAIASRWDGRDPVRRGEVMAADLSAALARA
jgi:hypothetical protein